MLAIQLDLFEKEPSKEEITLSQIEALEQSQDKLRKSFFARHADIMKIIFRQQKEIDDLKKLTKELYDKCK